MNKNNILCTLILSIFSLWAEYQIDPVIHFLKEKNISNPSIEKKLRDYVTEGNSILSSLTKGEQKQITNQLLTSDPKDKAFPELQNKAVDSIVALSWALFEKAIAKQQGFTGGAIVIVDPDQKIFNFLLQYVKAVNAAVKSGTARSEWVSSNPYAYMRGSTHFREFEKKPGFEQYGIEMRYMAPDGTPADLMPLLPGNKKQLLFGNVSFDQIPLTFIKWEEHGLYGMEQALSHAKNLYKKSQPDKIARGEKIPKHLRIDFKELLNAVKAIKPDFAKELLKHGPSHTVQESSMGGLSSEELYPIRTMYALTEKIINMLSPEIPAESPSNQDKSAVAKEKNTQQNIIENAKKLKSSIEKQFDHIPLRRGEEVILSS